MGMEGRLRGASEDSGERKPKTKQARKLQATLVRNYDPATDSLTEVRCRATSVAKNCHKNQLRLSLLLKMLHIYQLLTASVVQYF